MSAITMSGKLRLRRDRVGTVVITALLLALAATLFGSGPAGADEACSNQSLRLESNIDPNLQLPYSLELPNCRAYELVDPAYTAGAELPGGLGESTPEFISTDGSRLIAASIGAFANVEGSFGLSLSTYLAERTATGWRASGISPPSSHFADAHLVGASAELDTTLWLGHLQGESSIASSLYTRAAPPSSSCTDGATVFTSSTVCFSNIGSLVPRTALSNVKTAADPANTVNKSYAVQILGTSPTLKTILFELSRREVNFNPFWQGDHTEGTTRSVYAYRPGLAEPELVGVMNTKSLTDQASEENKDHINEAAQQASQCGIALGGDTRYNAIAETAAATEVFFTARSSTGAGAGPACIGAHPGTGPKVDEVYARVNWQATVPLSEPSLSVPGRECTGVCETDELVEANRSAGHFVGASGDGSRAFISTQQPLVNADGDLGADIYEMDIADGKVTAVDFLSHGLEAANVQGVAAVAGDGSHVYFVATGVLTTAKNYLGQQARAGADNLYVYERDDAQPSGKLSYIATLSAQDHANWDRGEQGPVETTGDGSYLVFQSSAAITPDDETGAPQIFEYAAETGELVRISGGSCPNSLASCPWTVRYHNDGNRDDTAATLSYARAAVSEGARYQAHVAVSADGQKVFFKSAEALTPFATEGVEEAGAGGRGGNLYEYSWQGTIANGNPGVILNDIPGNEGPSLVGIDSQARNVLVANVVPALVSEDTNTHRDIYDARIDGGFPEAPANLSECNGDGCREPSLGAAGVAAPESLGSTGVGNAVGSVEVIGVTERPTLRIVRAHVRRGVVNIKVRVAQSGLLQVAGNGVKTTRANIGAGVVQIRAALTRAGLQAVRHHRRIRAKVVLRAEGVTIVRTVRI